MDSNITFHIAGGLLLTEYGETCESSGLTPIGSLTQCEANIAAFIQTTIDEIIEDNSAYHPKGCYVYGVLYGSFNIHASGRGNSNSRALCIQEGRK